MKFKSYEVKFTDKSTMMVEAVDFNHASNQLEIICLLSNREVKSIELQEE